MTKKHSDETPPATRYLDENEVAERLRVSVKFLRRRRERREAPAFAKFGNRVRYPVTEVEKYEAGALQLCANILA